MRVVGLDIHRTFAEVMFLQDGELIHGGRVDLTQKSFSTFCKTLRGDDEVVLEATGNTISVVRLLEPHVGRVVIANPAQVRASQILTYEKEVAKKALQAIQEGEDFAVVAQTYSESEDAQYGGDLGFFSRGVMPPEFDDVIFSLKMGEVSHIIQTPYGYQIFKLTGQREAQRIAFDEVKDQIASMIKQQKRMMAIDLWMLELQNNAKIVLNLPVIKQVN